MTTDKTSSGSDKPTSDQPPSDQTKTAAKRKLKAGRRTARTSGMSQSAFAGYATTPPPPPAEPLKAEQEDRRKEDDNSPAEQTDEPTP